MKIEKSVEERESKREKEPVEEKNITLDKAIRVEYLINYSDIECVCNEIPTNAKANSEIFLDS